VRGADSCPTPSPSCADGPSPRARGRPCADVSGTVRERTIPACAGPTAAAAVDGGQVEDHPRVRGADELLGVPVGGPVGPSPRARGRRGMTYTLMDWFWTIPACAGPTQAAAGVNGARRDHPRVRGADRWGPYCATLRSGPSPRARGRRRDRREHRPEQGTIPACAGPTRSMRCARTRSGDHPRVRGADLPAMTRRHAARGPSPRARGRPQRTAQHPAQDGTIPACAGPTGRRCSSGSRRADHPRVRGADSRRPPR